VSRIIYGGVELKITVVNMCQREVVYDDSGRQPLFVRWMLDVSAVLSPEATSYAPGLGILGPTAIPVPNTSVVQTDRNIRDILTTPRLPLLYTMMSDMDLTKNGEAAEEKILDIQGIDAQNGPIPLRFNIVRETGNKVMLVDWAVETRVPLCSTSAAPVLISNSYFQLHELDQDYRLSRYFEGVAIFRSDLLASKNITPDSLRQQLMMPLPAGFRRDAISVQEQPDGCTLNYSFVDVEQAITFNPNGTNATRVEATSTRTYSYPGLSSYYG
jgi:hypothetical protein